MGRPDLTAYVTDDRLDLAGLHAAVESYDGSLGEHIALAQETERLLKSPAAQTHYQAIQQELASGIRQRVMDKAGHDDLHSHLYTPVGAVHEHLEEALTEAAMDLLENRLGVSMKAERKGPGGYERTNHVLGLLDQYLSAGQETSMRVQYLTALRLADNDALNRPLATVYHHLEEAARSVAVLPALTAKRTLRAYQRTFDRLAATQQRDELLRAAEQHGLIFTELPIEGVLSLSPTTMYELAHARQDYITFVQRANSQGVAHFFDIERMFSDEDKQRSRERFSENQSTQGVDVPSTLAAAFQHGGRELAEEVANSLVEQGAATRDEALTALDTVERLLKEHSPQPAEASLEELASPEPVEEAPAPTLPEAPAAPATAPAGTASAGPEAGPTGAPQGAVEGDRQYEEVAAAEAGDAEGAQGAAIGPDASGEGAESPQSEEVAAAEAQKR